MVLGGILPGRGWAGLGAESAEAHQPRATPWVQQPVEIARPEGAQGKMPPPLQGGWNSYPHHTQGVALGWYASRPRREVMVRRQGRIETIPTAPSGCHL
jgi:hypothetical protein